MNIFVLDTDPVRAAQLHCDKHVVKMVLESAQLLSTAVLTHMPDAIGLYRPTHKGHPCTMWASETRGNFDWLCELASGLVEEHALRYAPKRRHSSESVIDRCRELRSLIPAGGMTEHPQCMPDELRCHDAVNAYRAYYRSDKREFATWRAPRVTPGWMA